jgi:uncharacterized membrane protein (UPF0127 family)
MKLNVVARKNAAIVLLALFFGACATPSENKAEPSTSQPTASSVYIPRNGSGRRAEYVSTFLGDLPVRLEVSATAETRGRGLSGRTTLVPDQGMIFIYRREGNKTFWMKDCLIGLDIAYAGDDGVIFQVVSLDAPSGVGETATAESDEPARFVVEMPKGWFSGHGLGKGTPIRLTPEIARLMDSAEE